MEMFSPLSHYYIRIYKEHIMLCRKNDYHVNSMTVRKDSLCAILPDGNHNSRLTSTHLTQNNQHYSHS